MSSIFKKKTPKKISFLDAMSTVEKNDINTIFYDSDAYIACRGDMIGTTAKENTLLMYCALVGNTKLCKFFAQRQIGIQNSEGLSSLHIAILSGNLECALEICSTSLKMKQAYLEDEKARSLGDIGLIDIYGNTALMILAQHFYLYTNKAEEVKITNKSVWDLVDILCSNGEAGKRNKNNKTALEIAAEMGNEELVKYLALTSRNELSCTINLFEALSRRGLSQFSRFYVHEMYEYIIDFKFEKEEIKNYNSYDSTDFSKAMFDFIFKLDIHDIKESEKNKLVNNFTPEFLNKIEEKNIKGYKLDETLNQEINDCLNTLIKKYYNSCIVGGEYGSTLLIPLIEGFFFQYGYDELENFFNHQLEKEEQTVFSIKPVFIKLINDLIKEDIHFRKKQIPTCGEEFLNPLILFLLIYCTEENEINKKYLTVISEIYNTTKNEKDNWIKNTVFKNLIENYFFVKSTSSTNVIMSVFQTNNPDLIELFLKILYLLLRENSLATVKYLTMMDYLGNDIISILTDSVLDKFEKSLKEQQTSLNENLENKKMENPQNEIINIDKNTIDNKPAEESQVNGKKIDNNIFVKICTKEEETNTKSKEEKLEPLEKKKINVRNVMKNFIESLKVLRDFLNTIKGLEFWKQIVIEENKRLQKEISEPTIKKTLENNSQEIRGKYRNSGLIACVKSLVQNEETIELIQLLSIFHGGLVDKYNGDTAYIFSVIYGNFEFIKYLSEEKNIKNNYGISGEELYLDYKAEEKENYKED